MKTKFTPGLLAFLLIFLSSVLVMCGKSDSSPDADPETNKVPPPDPALAYTIINVGKIDNAGNLIYPTPDNFEFRTFPQTAGSLTLSDPVNDTARCFWMFRPVKVDANLPMPLYRFCDVEYQSGGTDQFSLNFYWSNMLNGATLQQGKTYNLNMFQNSLADTRGMVIYTHSKNNTLVKQMITFDYALTKSWIKIETISEGKASGSFLFSFTCANPGGAGGGITHVTGRFNKIPIQ